MTGDAAGAGPRATRRDAPLRVAADSPFGEVLCELLLATPGSLGAALADENGDAIDFAHQPAAVSGLDIELAAAQLGQVMDRLGATSTRVGLGPAVVLIEGTHRTVLVGPVGPGYIVTVTLDRRANLALALETFEEAAIRIAHLLV